MRLTRLRVTLASLVLLGNLLLAGEPVRSAPPQSGSAAQNQNPPPAQEPLRTQVSLANVFATVRDSHRAIIGDLTKDDFRLFEDNQEQKVAFFSKTTTMPITLGLLVDTSGSQSELLLLEQEAASRFLHRVIKKGDMAMVMNFDIDVNLLADFTEDTAMLERAIQKTQINAGAPPQAQGPFPQLNQTGTALYDAIYLACHDQLASQAGRKAIVILTDAEDVGSKLKLEDAIQAAQRADTVIHIILIADPGGYGFGGYHGSSIAKKLADETGGRMIDARNGKHLEDAFDQISEELRSQYVLGYYPTNAARDGTFRKIRVETTRSGLKVLSRRGYYAPAK
jgi:VWFA-related protein